MLLLESFMHEYRIYIASTLHTFLLHPPPHSLNFMTALIMWLCKYSLLNPLNLVMCVFRGDCLALDNLSKVVPGEDQFSSLGS